MIAAVEPNSGWNIKNVAGMWRDSAGVKKKKKKETNFSGQSI